MCSVSRVVTLTLLASAAGCTDEVMAPQPVITSIEPQAICPSNNNTPVLVRVSGSGFVINEDHTVASAFELWRSDFADVRKVPLLEGDLDGRSLTLVFQNGEAAPAANEPPRLFEARVVNPDDQFAIHEGTFAIHSPFGFGPISPTTASRSSPVTMNLAGSGFYGPMRVIIETQVPSFASQVEVTSPTTATATFDLSGASPGTYAVTMRNAGGCSYTMVSAFTLTP
jgi:hypothetical protein